jgi:hypothetical protein
LDNFFYRKDAKTQRIIPAIIAFSLFFYATLRAALLSFTHDESFTYIHYVTAPLKEVFFPAVISGNNHLLNTLLMKLSMQFFPPTELALRLPNLLGFALYLVFAYLLAFGKDQKPTHPLVRFSAFLLFTLNPYLLDFFSLARGYGLSLGLFMGYLYYTMKWIGSLPATHHITTSPHHHFSLSPCNPGTLSLTKASVLLFFAVLANITVITLFLASWIALNIIVVSQTVQCKKGIIRFLNLCSLLTASLLILCLFPQMKALIATGHIDYGGTTGFWSDTIHYLFDKSCYGKPYRHTVTTIATWLLALALTVSVIRLAFSLFPDKAIPSIRLTSLVSRLTSLVLLLFLLTWLGEYLQFKLFGTPYLMARTALVLWPVIGLLFLFLRKEQRDKETEIQSEDQIKKSIFQKISLSLCHLVTLSLILLLITNFLLTANLKSTLEWRFDADTKTVITAMDRQFHASSSRKKITCTWLFEPTMNFYRTTRNMTWAVPFDREGPFRKTGIHYVTPEDADSLVKLGGVVSLRVKESMSCVVVY